MEQNTGKEENTETPLTLEKAMDIMKNWGLQYEPQSIEAWCARAKALINIVGTEEKALWLSDRVIEGCNHFPAPIELRRIFCDRYPPADGREPREVDNTRYMGHQGPPPTGE